jgi:hypothetical protein
MTQSSPFATTAGISAKAISGWARDERKENLYSLKPGSEIPSIRAWRKERSRVEKVERHFGFGNQDQGRGRRLRGGRTAVKICCLLGRSRLRRKRGRLFQRLNGVRKTNSWNGYCKANVWNGVRKTKGWRPVFTGLTPLEFFRV